MATHEWALPTPTPSMASAPMTVAPEAPTTPSATCPERPGATTTATVRSTAARSAAARLRATDPAVPDGDPTPSPPWTTPTPEAPREPSRRPGKSGTREASTNATTGPPPGYVTAEMIAEELARITGKASIPASTIRGMASRDQMPAPTDRKWGRRTLWDATQIDRWLQQREARHVSEPMVRQIQRRLSELDEHARRTGNDLRLKEGVRDAHRRGLSYQQIADAIRVKNGDHHPTREAVRIRFRHYL